MAKENSKLDKDIERLKRRIQANEKSIHESEVKAENLNVSIQAAIRKHEGTKQKQPG